MNSNKLISIDDSDLEQVSGGFSFGTSLDAGRLGGASVSGDISRRGASVEAGVKVGRVKAGLGFGIGSTGW